MGFLVGNSLVRTAVAVVPAAIVTLLLFALMRALIFTDDITLPEREEAVRIDIFNKKKDTDVIRRDKRPEQPDEVKTPPPPPRIEAAKAEAPREGLATTLGKLPDLNPQKLEKGDIKVVVSDRDEQPLVRMEPVYPPRAAERGLEGSCVATFDVNPDGTITNVRTNCTSSLFDSAVQRAVSKWKYAPKVVDGQPVMRRNLQVEFPFKLTG